MHKPSYNMKYAKKKKLIKKVPENHSVCLWP